MTQGATGRLPAVATALQAGAAVVSSARIFLPSGQRHINDSSVKALLPGRGDLLSLARVGSRFSICGLLALDARETNEHVRQAKAADKTTSDFPQITAERK